MEDEWKEEESENNNKISISNPIPQVLQVLQALKQASQEIQDCYSSDSRAVKALLELHTILSADPNLSTLSRHLNRLKSLVDSLHNSTGLRSLLTRPISTHSIVRVASSIEFELQAWIDRETTESLSCLLKDPSLADVDELVILLTQFRDRVSQGFNRELQQLVLKFKLFSSLESLLCDAKCSQRVREHVGMVIAALIRFNKDVFVGQVLLMGPTVEALVSMASVNSIDVLCSLVRSIRSPIVDEIESNGEIPKIITLLNSEDFQLRVLAMECVLEIGYFGRKEAIEAMLKEALVEKLVELQRSEVGGELNGENEKGQVKEERFIEKHAFASCVARFAVQLEVGEGLRQREKRAFKPEILVRVKKASISDAETATIVSEVLWGTSP